jgi:purine-binding chemotaxis protein CheW
MEDITKMPNCSGFVEGVINLRGHVTTVMDLRKKLGITFQNSHEDTRIVIVGLENNTIGMIVDSVTEVLHLSTEDIDAADMITSQIEAEYIRGVGKLEDRILILLDLNRVLTSRETIQVKQAVEEAAA